MNVIYEPPISTYHVAYLYNIFCHNDRTKHSNTQSSPKSQKCVGLYSNKFVFKQYLEAYISFKLNYFLNNIFKQMLLFTTDVHQLNYK